MEVTRIFKYINLKDITELTLNTSQPQLIIKVTKDLVLNINADSNVILLANEVNKVRVNLSKHKKINLDIIALNSKNIDLEAYLMEDSFFEVNYLTLNKDQNLEVNQYVKHLGRNSYSMVNNKVFAFKNSIVKYITTGKIAQGVKNCNCNQLTRGVILSEDATISATPILLIDEFETKAYHGATIGQISDEDLFYLMSRGLSKNDAFKLVLNGLFMPIIDKININNLKEGILNSYLSLFEEL